MNENPNLTSGSLNAPKQLLRYPLNEALSSMTRLRFVKYDRFNPWDATADEVHEATITLPLPVSIPENYSMNTSSVDLHAIGNLSNEAVQAAQNFELGKLVDVAKSGIDTLSSTVTSKNLATAGIIQALNLIPGNDIDATTAIQVYTGITMNPHATMMFNGVNLRNINLEWRLSARSEDESIAIKNIFDCLKLRSHPAEAAKGFALNYPDLVYIEFDGKVKNYMPIFDRAMINNISILPDTTNGIHLYKSGAPVTYTLQIMATEISILTRDKLEKQMRSREVMEAPSGGTIQPSSPIGPNIGEF